MQPSDADQVMVNEVDRSRGITSVALAVDADIEGPVAPVPPPEPSEGKANEADRLRVMAGTWGDPVTPVENLAGVAPGKGADDGIVIWGARPGDSRVLVDGLEVPALMHLGSRRSAVGVNAPATVELVPGAYGADYGRALGGLVLIKTKELPTQGVHGAAEANLADSSLALAGAPTARFRLGASGTWSHATLHEHWLSQRVSAYYGPPSYRDFQTKAEFDITPQKRVALLALGAWEHLRPEDQFRNYAVYPSHGRTWSRIALRYSDDARNGTIIMPFVGWTRDDLEVYRNMYEFQRARCFQYGARASHDWWLSEHAVLTAALDGLITRAHYSVQSNLTFPVRDDTPVSVSDEIYLSLAQWRSTSTVGDVGASLALRWSLGPWTLSPALRTDLFVIRTDGSEGADHQAWAVQPRLFAAYDPRPWLGVHAAAGLYSQSPDPADLNPQFGNPRLGPARAGHASLGLRWRLRTWLVADATGFFRRSWDLPRPEPGSMAPDPRVLQDGQGRAWGGHLTVRQTAVRDLDAWVGYTFTHSDLRTPSSAPGESGSVWCPTSQDRTHTLVAVLAYRIRGWVPSLRARYATGTPYTPLVGTVLEAGYGYHSVMGEPNSARLPAFFHLDLRLGYEWQIAGTTASLAFDAYNLTSHNNGETVVYNGDYTRWTTRDAPPRTFYLVVRWQF